MKFKLWDRQETLYSPDGNAHTVEEVYSMYPIARLPHTKWIICDSDINMGVFMNFNDTKNIYAAQGMTFAEDATDAQIVDAIGAWEGRTVEQPPTAEERIAAAMEYQNVMTY